MDIYVGNINFKMDDEALKAAFETYGTVKSAKIIKDQETGRSKGFGFVTMPSSNEAEEAIRNLDGEEIDGRKLKVNEARPKPEHNGNRKEHNKRR